MTCNRTIGVAVVGRTAWQRDLLVQWLRLAPGIAVVGEAASLAGAMDLVRSSRPQALLLALTAGEGLALAANPALAEVSRLAPTVVLLSGPARPDGAAGLPRVHAVLDRDASATEVVAALRAAAGAGRPEPDDGAGEAAGETRLTCRERELLHLLAEGLSDEEIAARLGLRVSTVRTHLRRLFAKLGARSRLHALTVAIRRGLIALDPGGPRRSPPGRFGPAYFLAAPA